MGTLSAPPRPPQASPGTKGRDGNAPSLPASRLCPHSRLFHQIPAASEEATWRGLPGSSPGESGPGQAAGRCRLAVEWAGMEALWLLCLGLQTQWGLPKPCIQGAGRWGGSEGAALTRTPHPSATSQPVQRLSLLGRRGPIVPGCWQWVLGHAPKRDYGFNTCKSPLWGALIPRDKGAVLNVLNGLGASARPGWTGVGLLQGRGLQSRWVPCTWLCGCKRICVWGKGVCYRMHPFVSLWRTWFFCFFFFFFLGPHP